MTQEEAYIEGFCKAAEAAGVDPVALYKQAQVKTQLLGMLGRAGGRLLGAGRAAAGAAKSVGTAASGAAKSVGTAASNAAQKAKGGLKRYFELLGGGNTAKYEGQISAMDKLMGKLQGLGHNGVTINTPQHAVWRRAFAQKMNATDRLNKERGAVGMARGLTAYGAGGGVGILASRRAKTAPDAHTQTGAQ